MLSSSIVLKIINPPRPIGVTLPSTGRVKLRLRPPHAAGLRGGRDSGGGCYRPAAYALCTPRLQLLCLLSTPCRLASGERSQAAARSAGGSIFYTLCSAAAKHKDRISNKGRREKITEQSSRRYPFLVRATFTDYRRRQGLTQLRRNSLDSQG